LCEYIYNTFACVNTFTIHQFSKLDLKFGEFKVGQIFKSHIVIDKDDFQKYISFAKTRNILHEKPGRFRIRGSIGNTSIFANVIGYEGIKRTFVRSLNSKEPVRLLLIGPPGQAKTLSLKCILKRFGEYVGSYK
jgi:SpoVK/Ycf46/Vps4 family AAA+-type ATPase